MTEMAVQQTSPGRGKKDDRELRISRLFAAPRDAVFSAWTDPEMLAKWWGPEGCTASVMELDLQPGGAWRTCILGTDGEKHFVGGDYLEIDAPRKLVFTWAWEMDEVPGHQTTITLEFHDRGGSTELVMTQTRFETAEACQKHTAGWSSSLKCLEQCFSIGRK